MLLICLDIGGIEDDHPLTCFKLCRTRHWMVHIAEVDLRNLTRSYWGFEAQRNEKLR